MKLAIGHWRPAACALWLCLTPCGLAQPSTPLAGHAADPIYPIDLPTALRLAGAQNLDVQLARQRLAEARADNDSATLRLYPWLAPGVTYRRHSSHKSPRPAAR